MYLICWHAVSPHSKGTNCAFAPAAFGSQCFMSKPPLSVEGINPLEQLRTRKSCQLHRFLVDLVAESSSKDVQSF